MPRFTRVFLRALLSRLLAVLVMAASVLVPLWTTTAQAAASTPPLQWDPISLPDMPYSNHLISNPAGGVTVGCSNGTTAVKSFTATGSVVQFIPESQYPWIEACPFVSAVGRDGTLYTTVYDLIGNTTQLAAYRGNTRLWLYTPPCGQAGITSLVIGTNGNLYFLLGGGGSGDCGTAHLIGIESTLRSGYTTPQQIFRLSLSAAPRTGGLTAYRSGLVLNNGYSIQYVSYSGTASPVVSPSPGLGYHYGGFDATLSGRVFVPVKATSVAATGCANPDDAMASISAYEPSGRKWTAWLPMCSEVSELRPPPNGGVVAHISTPQAGAVGQVIEKLIGLTSSGQLAWSYVLPHTDGPNKVYQDAPYAIDLNGNVLLQRRFIVTEIINGSNWQWPGGVEFTLLSSNTGITLASFALSGGSDQYGTYGYQPTNPGEVTIAKNTIYLPVGKCYSSSGCDGRTPQLYAIALPGLQLDYPRGAILNVGGPRLSYVAMGDSFSSGEGVPSFLTGTDTAGPPQNRCHRSPRAYARLLAQSAAHPLTLQKFVACSGARTAQITGKWPNEVAHPINLNEDPQVDSLSTATKVVTISIGGNDVGFKDFVILCLFLDCSDPALKQTFFDRILTLDSALSAVYDQILTRAPNAHVYILGYPLLIRSGCSGQIDAGMRTLSGLIGLASPQVFAVGLALGLSTAQILSAIAIGTISFNPDEVTTAHDLTTDLDLKIKSVVASKGARITYVDPLADSSPFNGHDLCSSTSYFNGLDLAHPEYSYHPNAKGQDAYRRMIETILG